MMGVAPMGRPIPPEKLKRCVEEVRERYPWIPRRDARDICVRVLGGGR